MCVSTQIFERLPNYYKLQERLLFLEDRISQLLGGIQVIYVEELQPLLTLEEYYDTLDSFYNKLLDSRLPFHPQSLRGLQMILERWAFAGKIYFIWSSYFFLVVTLIIACTKKKTNNNFRFLVYQSYFQSFFLPLHGLGKG